MPPPRVTAILLSPRAKAPTPQTCTHTFSTQPHRPRPNHPQHHHQRAHNLSKPHIYHFTTSTPRQAKEPNFYEILDIPIGATPAEIKKQFYALSLRHHPDRNRSDPSASQRFARISAAYNVLSNAQKRATYDRDHGLHAAPSYSHSASTPGHTHAHPMGSHSSYAGSRPASGLSKRRNAFHGPPPSFYEQGGYGATGRREERYTAGKAGPGAGAGAGGGAKAGAGFASAAGFGSGEGAAGKDADPEDWVGFIKRNPVHHFNARGHFRTQAAEDQRRRERRTRAAIEQHAAEHGAGVRTNGVADDTMQRFFIVTGILIFATGVTGFFKWPAATPHTADVVHGGKARQKEAFS
ncbi:uncharacterized protein N7511_009502 [Penicillium nucicola]|uniref:uncharacterized protein n=1 Tax=Penicillium nucicola TaxID=1850975 RepID=UPI002544DF59|nr:uncharacterized protein N7511_009502 [Penicillium nucicola]KAJ5747806.1 hypothetical protein N7511_009502 [Penicillium nucicola]